MAENKKRNGKSFFMKKGYSKSGKEFTDGALKMFVKKPYGSNDVFTTRDVMLNGKTQKVGNVVGSVFVDEYAVKALKYNLNLNTDIPADVYVNVRLAFWGKKAELFEKCKINEGDLVMFFCSSFSFTTFAKKDGTTGYQIEGNVYDWDVVKKNKQTETSSTADNGDMDAVAESDFNAMGFTECEDDGDLPF